MVNFMIALSDLRKNLFALSKLPVKTAKLQRITDTVQCDGFWTELQATHGHRCAIAAADMYE